VSGGVIPMPVSPRLGFELLGLRIEIRRESGQLLRGSLIEKDVRQATAMRRAPTKDC